MKTTHYLIRTLILAVVFISCKKNDLDPDAIQLREIENLNELITPPGFNYSATREIRFEIQLYAPDGTPISGIPVQINEPVNETYKKLFTLYTNKQGFAEGTFSVPAYLSTFVISPNYIGIPNNMTVPVNNNLVSLKFNRSGMPSLALIPEYSPGRQSITLGKKSTLNYKYLSSYNKNGVPSKLEKRDVISSGMLDFINNSLPESKNLAQSHPAYLEEKINTDIDITEKSEVWVTFVHEGAGYKNSLCFYKYKTSSPPKSVSDIDTSYIVFPNTSFMNSGGGLYSGDKVKLGVFDAGTSIGFICISNGWNGSSVDEGYFQLFTDKTLNDVSKSSLNQHTVMLYDNVNEQFYFGCEDIKRDNSSCDNDFNDVVFYVKSNPIEAISTEAVPLADNGYDTDKDGVSDIFDAFPNNKELAYKNYLPSAGNFGTLAFEDSWPGKGDYDFNDLVIGYQFEQWTDADNKIKEMKCKLLVRAIGANYYHGFGFQLNTGGSEISYVKGASLTDKLISLEGNQLESGQKKATIIAFDNDYTYVKRARGQMMNTVSAKEYITPDTLNLHISFNSSVTASQLGTAPYNPFIFINGDRGKEVHLPGYAPTELANSKYFRTYHDNTNPAKNTYYKTLTNLPYALNIPESFEYPVEGKAINSGYLKFANWAQSGGGMFTDWYKNSSGYRDNSVLFFK